MGGSLRRIGERPHPQAAGVDHVGAACEKTPLHVGTAPESRRVRRSAGNVVHAVGLRSFGFAREEHLDFEPVSSESGTQARDVLRRAATGLP